MDGNGLGASGGALAEMAGERVAKSKAWPDSPRALAGRLRRAATFLRKIGIEIAFGREGWARMRIIRIRTSELPPPETRGMQPSAPSASSAPTPKSNPHNNLVVPDPRTDDSVAEAPTVRSSVRANSLRAKVADGADDADANHPLQSASEKPWRARL